MWGLVEFFQLRDWKILGRMIKELFGLKHIYTLFKNGMAILPCDKLLICSFHWFVHACQIKTAIYTSARTHTQNPFLVKSHFYESHRVTPTVLQHRLLLSISVMVDK